ncbi:MAG: hypothetical protein Q7S87_04970 [Agitococcus sp.]|nr:hypothetical protein [Agitococcus sp.]
MTQILRWSINFVALLAAASLSYADTPTLCGLSVEETSVLRHCLDQKDTCRQYWPSQQTDLQDCGRTKQWVGWAMSAPVSVKEQMLGKTPALSTEAPVSPTDNAPAAQVGAWKNLPRRSDSLAPKGAPTMATNTQNPYGGTSDKIEAGAARAAAADFWVGSLNRIATVAEQVQSANNVGGSNTGGSNTKAASAGDFEQYYRRYSKADGQACSPDVSNKFRSRWSRFTDPNLREFFQTSIAPGKIRQLAEEWAPRVAQYSRQEQRNDLGQQYFRALEAARNACQITTSCNDGDQHYESFPQALQSNITTQGRVGQETGALVAYQVAYAALQMNAEFNNEYANYIWNCMK